MAWTLAFLAPNVLLVMWLFRFASPLSYVATIYGLKAGNSDTPLTATLPLAGLCIAGLFAWLCRRFTPRQQQSYEGRNPFELGLLVAIFLAVALSIVLIGPGLLLSFLRVGAGMLVIATASGIGLRVIGSRWLRLSPERFVSPLELLVFSAALGLGIIALLVFGLGSAGVVNKWIWWIVLSVLFALSFRPFRKLAAELRTGSAGFVQRNDPIAVAAVSFVILWIVLHAVLIWTMPVDYDVLEYHLAAPAQYLRDGHISFLHENSYATLPENGEMLFLLGLILSGDKLSGLPIAHTILFGTWALTIAGVYALSQRLLKGGASVGDTSATNAPQLAIASALAALIYALIPQGSRLLADFFVEHVQALLHLAAVGAVAIFFSERRAGIRDTSGWLLLSGILAGLCCGTKTTAMLLTAAPLAVLIPAFCWYSGSIHLALSSQATFVIPLLLTFAPWLARNGWVSGDPLSPLGEVIKKRMHPAGVAPDHIDHLEVNIRSGELSFRALMRTLRDLFPPLERPDNSNANRILGLWVVNAESGPQLLSFSLPGFFAIRNIETAFVVILVLVDIAAWFLFTYRINRFFYPLCSLLAVVAALGIDRLWNIRPLRKGVVAVILAMIWLLAPLPMMYLALSRADSITGLETPADAARMKYHTFGNGDWFEAWRTINALPAVSKVLCLGDAQTFYLDKTPSYSVVFNASLLEEALLKADTPDDVFDFLNAHGITHIYINYPEWFRLDQSYALTRSPENKWEPARLDGKTIKLLRSLLQNQQILAYGQAWPADIFPAYLKLNEDEYRTLEQFLNEFTEVEWTAPNQSCEIRRIQKRVERN